MCRRRLKLRCFRWSQGRLGEEKLREREGKGEGERERGTEARTGRGRGTKKRQRHRQAREAEGPLRAQMDGGLGGG